MTILTKPSMLIKKVPLIDTTHCEEEVIDMPERPWKKQSFGTLCCMVAFAAVVTVIVIGTGAMLYRQYLHSNSGHRYQGYCSIPIATKNDPQLIEPNYRVMPLRWTSDPDVQIFSTNDEDGSEDMLTALREELEIGDTVEKISVLDNGRQVSFIHDFDANVTGIVDADRCFLMDLDASLVLAPDVFVVSIERGGDFDVTRVRTSLRALLPALAPAPPLPPPCRQRPSYRLEPATGAIRKRSADAPSHDYIQFAGRHVQEIEISNLAELLQHEQAQQDNH